MRSKTLDVAISETLDEMVVDHADRLHVCVDHGRSDEAESTALEIAAEYVGLGGGRGNLAQRAPAILLWPAIHELPAVGVEASEFFLHGEKRPRVLHRGGDLHPVPDDPGIIRNRKIGREHV